QQHDVGGVIFNVDDIHSQGAPPWRTDHFLAITGLQCRDCTTSSLSGDRPGAKFIEYSEPPAGWRSLRAADSRFQEETRSGYYSGAMVNSVPAPRPNTSGK